MNVDSLRQNKWVRRLAVTLLIVLGFWAVAWVAVPPIAKSQIQKIASEKLGRTVTVGKIDFKPWTLELTLSDLRIASADGGKSQLAISRIYANAELQSILRLGPVIDTLSIDAPAVHLTHFADGKYDIDDILARLAAAAPPPDPSKQSEPPNFAIYNISVSGGSFDFDDQVVKRKHELRDLVLKIPFLSNLASKRDINTEPQLAFVLNGSRFDSNAFSTPFAQSRKTDVRLNVQGLDLVPYLGYIPGGLPVALRSGKLDADLRIDFERAATGGLKVTGTVGARDIKAVDRRGQALLGFESLKIALADVRPLERVVHLGEVTLASPRLVIAKDAAGQLNLLATDPATGATEKTALPSAPAAAPAPTPAQPAWRIQVDKVALNGGEIGWRDQTVQPAADIDVKQLEIDVRSITWPMDKPAAFNGSTTVAGAAIKFSGQATDKLANVSTELDGLPLSLAAPYLAQSLEPTLDGKLSGVIDVAWAAPALKFKARRLAADGLALTQGKAALASIGRFELIDAEADMANHTLAIASFSATNPKVTVERDDQKRWMFKRWLKALPGGGQDLKAAPPKEAVDAPANAANSKPWALSIGTVAIDNGALAFSDKSSDSPVAFELSAIKLKAQKITPDTATVSPVELSGRIGAGRADAGRFDYKGSVVLKPLAAEGTLQAAGIPVHAFKAYYADPYNVDVRRAFASFRGNFKYASAPAGMSLKLMGDTAVDDFRANSATLTQSPGATRGNQLLSWKTLSLRGLQLTMVPSAPLAVDVRETTLTDFFARVIVDPSGSLNLQGLTKKTGPTDATAPRTEAASTRRSLGGTSTTTIARPATRPGGAPLPPEAMVGGGPDNPAAAPKASAASASTEPASPAPVINFGPMNLVNGRIDFTDLFVKPNYSANLSELTGKLSAFSSRPQGDKPALADLELHGKAQQTAQLDITGKLNPLAKPLELDITAKMRELDLPPLSPYAVRYAGHGIERGKLSMSVNYKIAADGQLTAANKLVLNQLQFGEEVAGAPASLPVRLAVALLADRNGVIDVDLPLSGSLNDPQFSIGPLIFKAIVNLIVKAATAPFNLLAGGLSGGGGGESSAVVFAPGSAVLKPEAKESLDKLAKSLIDRPGLNLTMIGTASLDQEREPYQRERLRQLAQAEKRRAAVRSNQDAADVTPVTDAEYPELLAAIYKRADIKKSRNLVGFAKDVPTEEMEALLVPTIPVDEETMRQLALARGAAVRDYLLANKVPSERLFLGAVRTRASGSDWKPEAELKLATR